MGKSGAQHSTQDRSIFQFGQFNKDGLQGKTRERWSSSSQLSGNVQILPQLGIVDLTQQAYEGKLPRSIGMRRELNEVFMILSKRFSPTPLLFGQNGVGKSTLPIIFASRIIQGRVPLRYRSTRILQLNLSLLSAGAGIRGELGQRLRNYFTFLDQNLHIITVIDECQLLVARDYADSEMIHCFKTNLQSGKYRFILITDTTGITLLTEDPAIMGRVGTVRINMPKEKQVLHLFQGAIQEELSNHHGVCLTKDLIHRAYHLSEEYMPYDRSQPARTVKLLDTAMARASLRQDALEKEIERREAILPVETLQETARGFCKAGERILTPEERLQRLHLLPDELKKAIVGQDAVIDAVVANLKTRCIQQQPALGIYFFYGDSGVGKTELATQFGKQWSGSDSVFRVDCSQLIDRWAATMLLGSFPGLVMSDRSSMLSQVRIHPYSTFIWDEIEKAHPEVLHLFLQILQPPFTIIDNRGVKLDFSKSLFFFTSNIGHSDSGQKKEYGFQHVASGKVNTPESTELMKYFPNEFVGRFKHNVYRFRALGEDEYLKITDIEIDKLSALYNVELRITPEAKKELVKKVSDNRCGVRGLQAELSRLIEPEIQEWIAEKKGSQTESSLFEIRKSKKGNRLVKSVHK